MEKINILYSMLCRDFHDKAVKKIRKSLNVGNEIAITEFYEGDIKKFKATYECGDVYFARYYKFAEYKNTKAVDDDIINKMSPYAMEIMKMMDRQQSWGFSFEERMILYFDHIRFWDYVLDFYEINRVVFLNLPHEVVDYVIYCLCKIKKINMSIVTEASPFGERSIIVDDIDKIGEGLDELLGKYKEEYADVDIEQIELPGSVKKTYDRWDTLHKEKNTKKMLKKRNWQGTHGKEMWHYRACMDIRIMLESKYKGKINAKEVANNLSRYMDGDKKIVAKKYEIMAELKTKGLLNYYESLTEKPRYGEKYILFAMHFQPEATTSPQAGGIYSNQLIAIEILANNLPKGVKLYVKEHPNQSYVGKTKELYDRIKRIKNVRLISIKENQYELIKNSLATSTITGTTACESAFFNKPCIIFGRVLYKHLDGIYCVRTNEECKNAIEEIINCKKDIDIKNVKLFFKAVYEYSLPINKGYGHYNIAQNANSLAQGLIEHFEKTSK